jgi:hypothetical protein
MMGSLLMLLLLVTCRKQRACLNVFFILFITAAVDDIKQS